MHPIVIIGSGMAGYTVARVSQTEPRTRTRYDLRR
jgi:thioredoxin reductase